MEIYEWSDLGHQVQADETGVTADGRTVQTNPITLRAILRFARRVRDLETLGDEMAGAAMCASCGRPASCLGAYEGQTEPSYGCDVCCGHGCEDGACVPLAEVPARIAALEAEVEQLRGKLATYAESAGGAVCSLEESLAAVVAENRRLREELAGIEAAAYALRFSAIPGARE